MSNERDEYIKRLMAKAEQQRERETRPRSTARGSSGTASAPAVGKNGRQAVERPSAVKSTQRGTPKSTQRSTPKSAPRSPQNPQKTAAQTPQGTPKNQAKQKPQTDSEAHIWASLFLIFVALFLTMSVISYMIYFEADEYLAYFQYLFNSSLTGAENWGGKLGAILGNLIVGRSFGVMGLGVPVIVMIWAIKVLGIPTLPLRKATRSTVIVMLVGSVALGQFAGIDTKVFGSGYGGDLGIYVAEWFQGVLGYEGTSLLVALGGVGILYFVNSGWIRSFVRWIGHRMEHSRLVRAARMMAERERDEQLRAQLAASAAARMAAAASAVPAAAKVEQIVERPVIEQVVEPVIEPKPQIEIEAEILSQAETEAEVEPEKPKPTVDSSCLLALQGGQWGYIFDWDVSGTPVYCYLDRAALAAVAPAVSPMVVAANKAQAAAVESDEPHDVEFIVKSYDKPEPEIELAPEVEAPKVETPEIKAESTVESPTTKRVHFTPSPDDPNFIVEQTAGDELLDDRTINLTELYDPTRELASYRKPPIELMHDHSRRVSVSDEELVENKNKIVHTLETFGIKIDTIEATIGPTVTLYEIIPAPGVRISKIKNLEDDIALSLSALGIRIIAPIPGRGTIGIEVPNKEKETVSMYSVIKSAKFQESKAELPVALGKTIQNETFVLDLAKMPHLLVAGATGQGKSVGLNAILTSLLYKKHPSELKFILVDPKKVELTLYAKLEKHFLAKMPGEDEAIITDTQKVIYTLNSICVEMDARYDLLKAAKVRNISEYNDKFTHRRLNPEKGHRFLPYFVVIIDEFADLIMTAGREVETPIARIAQLARAVGIHLIIATQRPTTNIITGVIKANFPARIAFRVTSMIDSRTILDSPGANQLVGRGDMLVSTGSEVTRVQCAFIDTPEVDKITEFISAQRGYTSAYELPEYVPESEQNGLSKEVDTSKRDPLFEDVAHFVVSNQSGSASVIQRKFSIGFNRAGRLIDQLEAAGIVGRADGSKARQVLIQDVISLEMLLD